MKKQQIVDAGGAWRCIFDSVAQFGGRTELVGCAVCGIVLIRLPSGRSFGE